MNYRHIYHAGNICDVVKHSVLCLMLDYLRQKDKAFAVLDTHAGCGLYDLSDPLAQKTGEAEEGVQRVWKKREEQSTATLKPYLDLLQEMNEDGVLRHYPGSPMIIRRKLRVQDRLIACELHPDDARTLRRAFRDDKQAHIHHRDGYEALKALLPFPEKRGLVLIDPPFETTDEIDNLVKATKLIQKLAPTLTVAIWYPVKDRPTVWRFHEGLREMNLPDTLIAEFIYRPEVRHDRLNGSGFVFVNPPWTLEGQLQELFPALHAALETEEQKAVIKKLATQP